MADACRNVLRVADAIVQFYLFLMRLRVGMIKRRQLRGRELPIVDYDAIFEFNGLALGHGPTPIFTGIFGEFTGSKWICR